jgi:hypothetical protein
MVKIFLLGTSQSGKTTLAKRICDELSLQHVSASAWVRKNFKKSYEDKQIHIQSMTAFAIDQLKHNPFICIQELQTSYDLNLPSVVEGIRNPFDFVHLFDTRTDCVIWVKYKNNKLAPTLFEKGLLVVDALLSWQVQNELVSSKQIFNFEFEYFDSHEKESSFSTFENRLTSVLAFVKEAI